MTYYRTKSGVYEHHDVVYCYNDVVIVNRGVNRGLVETIVRQADTIKELCDCFVYVKDGKHKVFESYEVNPYFDYKYKDAIYGAIWTKVGLIYVAKMNEEGELELL